MIEVKKPLNLGFKRIPISPNEKNVNRLNNINQNLISINQNEENINKMKSIHSYTTSKLLENQTLLSNKSQNNENFDRKSSIKGINLLETNKSKKSISNDTENRLVKWMFTCALTTSDGRAAAEVKYETDFSTSSK